MTQTNPQCFHQSASSIAAFKACPQRFRLAYREGLRLAEDTDSQRVGTNWHKMHEVYYAAFAAWESGSGMTWEQIKACSENAALEAVIEQLNQAYANCPQSKTLLEWNLERQILLTSFIGYLWYWQADPIEVLASEVPFNLPIHAPKVGLPLPMDQVQRVGKIDHIIKWQNMVGSLERKSTSRSIAPDSDYWDKSKKDTQVSQYALAIRDMLPFANQMTAAVYGPFFELPLSQGKVAIVDEKDRWLVEGHPWHAWENRGAIYAATNIKTETGYEAVRLHQFLIGDIEEEEVIDHINGDKLDNRRCNLRVTNQSINRLNADTRGTSWHKASKKWVARITIDGRTRSLGYFDDEASAHDAYIKEKTSLMPRIGDGIGNTLYDVWAKPKTKPAMLTQKETAEFQETGVYCDQTFQFKRHDDASGVRVLVDATDCDVEQGKKGFAIRETVEMYGARLLQDIYARPDFYFQRREIVRTDKELAKFRNALYAIYQTQRTMDDAGAWYENEASCRDPFPCSYRAICYGPGADSVCDGKTIPPGYRRIFVDLTVNSVAVEE